ncbi:MAG: hypothetical protein JXA89_22785, partial [Anaerolineae bacterium]|nr:hypothetical protein [Anaerolineae bacterium]
FNSLQDTGGMEIRYGDAKTVHTLIEMMAKGPAYELGILPGDRFDDSQAKGRVAARQQLWRGLYNAMTLCQFQNPGVEKILRALNSVTGWHLEQDDLITLGMRIITLKRLLNLRRGLDRVDECLPKLLTRPLQNGTEQNVPNLDEMLTGAYAEYGWDLKSGHPLPETLIRLGL